MIAKSNISSLHECNQMVIALAEGNLIMLARRSSGPGLLLLLLPQCGQANPRDLYHLESDAWNITLRLAFPTEPREQNLIILIDKIETTIIRHYKCMSQLPYLALAAAFHKVLGSPKAVTFFPFLINCTLTHLRMALFGCFASTPTFSNTMPLA